MSMVSEASIEDAAVRRAEAAGFYVRKVAWLGRRSAPDRLFASEERGTVWIEFKKPGEEPTKAQYREHERMRTAGMEVHWTDSVVGACRILGIKL